MSLLKSAVKSFFSGAGYTLQKKGAVAPVYQQVSETMENGFNRIKQLGINPSTIIDIGAAQGTWTEKAIAYWPSARYELVEPLTEQEPVLNALKQKHPTIHYHLAVAGETPGETFLNVSPDLDGSGVYGRPDDNARKVPVITIDDITRNQPGTIVIKLDTHGYEVPILNGAMEALKRTAVLIIEVYGFHVSPTCLLFHELSAHLDGLGFRLFDIVDVMRRPGDNAFWQADAFYVRKDNAVFEKNSYA